MMMHSKRMAGTLPRRRPFSAAAAFCIIAIATVAAQGAVPPGMDCAKWIDSLINAGVRSLERNDIPTARQYLTAAYECGMSKDSMHYFAAEMYLRSGAFDTALIFNWALEKGGRFDRKLYLEQRARIFRTAGGNRSADSLQALYRRRTRHDVSLSASSARNGMAIGPITFIPQQLTFKPEADIDDAGQAGCRYKITRMTNTRMRTLFAGFEALTDLPVPTRHSFDEANDTIMSSGAVFLGTGEFPATPELRLGYRARVHADFKTDHYTRGTGAFSIGKTGLVSATGEVKLIRGQGMDESRLEMSCMKMQQVWKFKGVFAATLAHHFSRFDLYQDKAGVVGIYPPLPLGYVDSFATGQPIRYFKDKGLTTPYQSVFLDEYWQEQPGMKLLQPLPEHDINSSVRASWQSPLPLGCALTVSGYAQGVAFLKKIRWYTTEDLLMVSPWDMYKKHAIVYNAADGIYYLNTERADLNYSTSGFIKLLCHEKRRVDCYLGGSVMFERRIAVAGKVYFMITGIKGFSTLYPKDPVATFDYGWALQGGWSKDFSPGYK
jgi:hypothetical protein